MNKRLIGLITCLLVVLPKGLSSDSWNSPVYSGKKMFSFGSNMMASRIHIQMPTAVRIGAAQLHNYRLDFAHESSRWNGATATIVPTPGAIMWGTLWEINGENLRELENHIEVNHGIYESHIVHVKLRNETKLTEAITYLLKEQPESNLYKLPRDMIPESRQPSKTYLQSMVKGAIESSVPEDYVQRLRSIKHNGRIALEMEKQLELKDVVL